ncbi:MAG TPA: GNAT family N-acetyltransferase [Candidatus Didemnitutus sp.]|nr:GNAT family N-acetyltransferase [Candidatus Didemnitutus sp.]
MSPIRKITLREVEPSDVGIFYEFQLDPEANRMAAFVNPRDRTAFEAHWKKILAAPRTTNRTIVADGKVAGNIACFPMGADLEVTYWIGREFWGRGVATEALRQMLLLVPDRPLGGRAASDNLGSIRVLQKCGFRIVGKDKGFAKGRGEETEEVVLRLDSGPA